MKLISILLLTATTLAATCKTKVQYLGLAELFHSHRMNIISHLIKARRLVAALYESGSCRIVIRATVIRQLPDRYSRSIYEMACKPLKKSCALSALIAVLLSPVHRLPAAEPPKVNANGMATAEVAGTEADEADQLAKQLSNPVAALISVPFQANEDFHIGPANGNKFTLNIQPVIPISISKDWNLILRTILPIISQTDIFGHSGTQSGLGDTTQSFFLSPKAPGWGGLIWGLGPVGYYPTATNDLLGAGKWGLGPTFVVLKQSGGWTVGALGNQIWSVGGNSNRNDISAMFLQPFVSYTWKTHTTLTLNTESTYNWETSQWTVPLNLAVSQILKIGKQPVSIQLGGRYYAESPNAASHWGMRLVFTLLYPTAKPKPGPVAGTSK